jgi:hypothetical protein
VGLALVRSSVDAAREHPSDALATVNREQELVEVRRSPEDNADVGGQVNASRRSLDSDAVL